MGWKGHMWNKRPRDPWVAWEQATGSIEETVTDLRKDVAKNTLVHVMMSVMTSKEIEDILMRLNPANKSTRRLSDLNRARLIVLYPKMEERFPLDELEVKVLIALCNYDFDKYIAYIDVNLLTREQVKYFLSHNNGKFMKYISDNLLPERMQEIFTTKMWGMLLKRFPSKAKFFDATRIRNQTELRRFLSARPSLFRQIPVETMKQCTIDGPTWVRIITKLPPAQRKYIDPAFRDWAKKDIFTEMLKGRRFKPFKSDWDEGIPEKVDAE